jgi:hypothetical protein
MPMAILLFITVLLSTIVLWAPVRASCLKRHGLCVEGQVTGRVVVDKDENHHTALTISYVDHDGRQREVKRLLMTTKSAPEIGTRVPLAYRPGRPHKARMLTYTWKATRSRLILVILGLWWLGSAFFVFTR